MKVVGPVSLVSIIDTVSYTTDTKLLLKIKRYLLDQLSKSMVSSFINETLQLQIERKIRFIRSLK